ncbi:MAG: FKBP-type peptidyl-prolyl cis-trans isomerase [Verrucomicrobiales bacterium]|jgi:FKBP-type peptidyl-prolyl cis-trans isomerase
MRTSKFACFLVVGAAASLLSITVNAEDIKAPKNVAKAPDDAQVEKSGLVSKVIKKGTGDTMPGATDKVKVHYTGWTTDGKMFDSSVVGGEPLTFPLNGVIKGWTEGLQLMVEGEKRRFWIPANLAYGENPGGGRPGGMLCFDVELIENLSPKPPEDVAEIPDNAEKTESGMASRLIVKGSGKIHPKGSSTVTVHYSGWTTDGKLFDSSLDRGRAVTFQLNQVIPGWTEGVQFMVVGEKRRFWIPARLAYGENPEGGRPTGMLVFDVELLDLNDSKNKDSKDGK